LYLNLGIPSVTFISPLPAKWNVFNVICVEGSPIDWNQINTHYKVQKHKKYINIAQWTLSSKRLHWWPTK